jgi:hypothetical protein
MIWNSDKRVLLLGKKTYTKGDKIPDAVLTPEREEFFRSTGELIDEPRKEAVKKVATKVASKKEKGSK